MYIRIIFLNYHVTMLHTCAQYPCNVYVYVRRLLTCVLIFVNTNIIYPLQHTINIVILTTNTHIVRESSSPHIPTPATRDSLFVPSTLTFRIFSKFNL